jgi:glucose/arabinose dehydrogenase
MNDMIRGLTLALLAAPALGAEPSVQVLQENLEHPWALAFLPDEQGLLITERRGRLRLLRNGQLSAPLGGVPEVYARGQGGLLDVVLSPDFASDRLVYLAFAEADPGSELAGTSVGRGRLSEDGQRLESFHVIFRELPRLSSGTHFGSRLVFDRQGLLFITLGDNSKRLAAQQLDKLQGKVVRLHADGSVPRDNPFVDHAGARPEIWSYGHRNPQGAAINPRTGELWTHEHGPRGGDEINIPEPGKNYGWPLATHGINYNHAPVPEAHGTQVPGAELPLYAWKETLGVSGMALYDHGRFPGWQGSLFIGALVAGQLIRLRLNGNTIVGEERLLEERGSRIRDVRMGPDGYLYLLTDSARGQLLKVGLK